MGTIAALIFLMAVAAIVILVGRRAKISAARKEGASLERWRPPEQHAAAAPAAVTKTYTAPTPAPVTKALLIKIDTHGMSKAGITAIQATNEVQREIEITDARTLRRYVPYGADVHNYPVTCPHCGWCEMFDGRWVKEHGVLTCSRCECRTILYKTVSTEMDPMPIMSLREREIALAVHPEAFRQKWVPHGQGTTLRKGLNISAHIRYNGLNGVVDTAVTIKSLIGFELTSGFKVIAFTATPEGETKQRKFSLWQVEAMHDGRNGVAIPDPQEWLCGQTGLAVSPD